MGPGGHTCGDRSHRRFAVEREGIGDEAATRTEPRARNVTRPLPRRAGHRVTLASGMVHGGASGDLARDPLVGQVLSQRYRILAKLGEGAMAAVYLAEHTGVGATIVLKVLLPELASEPQAVDSFLREARIASEIHHDNVIDIFYSGRSPEGHVFLAMEYVDGATLFDVLEKDGPLPWARAKPILSQIAGALAAAHKHGVVHRDVKPENVLVGKADATPQAPGGPVEVVKVVDFGIANTRGDGDSGVCGTPAFMPPEQAQGLPPDARDDVYAFGCLMYQVLTGDVPFRDADMAKVLLMHLRDPPVPPRQKRPDLEIPAAAQAIVMRALEKSRADRWQDMGEVQKMLEEVAVEEPEPPAEALAPSRLAAAAAQEPGKRPPRIIMPKEQGPVRSRLPVIVGATLVLAASAFAFFRYAALHAPGRIEIVTEPAEAEIYIDGQKMADRSPMFLDASPGSYTVLVRSAGYEPLTRVLEMKPRAAERVPMVLTALPGYKPPPPTPRARPGAAAEATPRRRAAPKAEVNGVTFIDFKKAAAEQKQR
jgi:tRNA A-37 threonylcarbamoyl transferase component Bud32